jgi:hypothetical protein
MNFEKRTLACHPHAGAMLILLAPFLALLDYTFLNSYPHQLTSSS